MCHMCFCSGLNKHADLATGCLLWIEALSWWLTADQLLLTQLHLLLYALDIVPSLPQHHLSVCGALFSSVQCVRTSSFPVATLITVLPYLYSLNYLLPFVSCFVWKLCACIHSMTHKWSTFSDSLFWNICIASLKTEQNQHWSSFWSLWDRTVTVVDLHLS